ncbi:MAG: hypothetical protein NTU85_01565 [Candidatus Kaiserbacteria bacterium]|nr:hypothetical protein [Candidatus Kaiserbacteria bacterium]
MTLPASASAPSAPTSPDYTVTLTAYNAVPAQTDADPFVTASGAYSNPEIIAARSQDLAKELPFGTIIEIKNPPVTDDFCGYKTVASIIGYRVIADTMNARYTDYIDVLFSTKSNYTSVDGSVRNASTILGNCDGAVIRVVGHIDLTHTRMPKTQSELAAIVKDGSAPLAVK